MKGREGEKEDLQITRPLPRPRLGGDVVRVDLVRGEAVERRAAHARQVAGAMGPLDRAVLAALPLLAGGAQVAGFDSGREDGRHVGDG